jgi:hypothetical protein
VNWFAEGGRNSPHPVVGTTAIFEGPTMRLFVLSTLTAAAAVAGSTSITAPAVAQASAPCGPVAYSVAEQKYVGVPCTH